MAGVYFKTDSSQPEEVFCTPDGRINFFTLGYALELDPTSIALNGTRFPTARGKLEHTWVQIEEIFKQRRRPVGRTQEDPVIVTGETTKFQAEGLVGYREEGMNARKGSYCSMRRTTTVKLCQIVDKMGAVLIRAPPGSGKTSLLQLIAQNNTRDIFENVYYISLAALSGSERTFESLWAEWHPGVGLNEIRSPKDKKTNRKRPNLILVDEGQAAFDMNLTLWGTLKDIIGGHKEHLRMIVVSAWGSEIVFEGRKTVPTPVQFPKSATVSLWPTPTGVSLQFTQIEALEVWDGWCQMVLGVGDSLMSFDDLRDYIFTLTGRQPGLLLHILDWLHDQGLANIPAGSRKQKARSLLLSSSFYESLSSLRSLLSLRKVLRGGNLNAEPMRGLVRLLLREEPLRRSSLSGLAKDAAEKAVLWGQVIEEQDVLKIPSQLHRLFLCRELYCSADASSGSVASTKIPKNIDGCLGAGFAITITSPDVSYFQQVASCIWRRGATICNPLPILL